MTNLGYVVVSLAFLGGAFFTVCDEEAVVWAWFLPTLMTGIIGVVLIRFGKAEKTRSQEVLTANIENVQRSLEAIVKNITALNEQKGAMDPYQVRHHLDELFPGDLETFVESRESIGHVYGLDAYAEVMGQFASAERYLNRAWSASADGYVDEVHSALQRAQEQFTAARDSLLALEEQA